MGLWTHSLARRWKIPTKMLELAYVCHAYEACGTSNLVQESVKYSSHNWLPWVWGFVKVSLSSAPQDHLELGIVMKWILKHLMAVERAYCWKIHLYGGGWETSTQCYCKIDQCMLVCREWLHSMFHAEVEEWLNGTAVWLEWKMLVLETWDLAVFRAVIESQGLVLAVTVPVVRDDRNK